MNCNPLSKLVVGRLIPLPTLWSISIPTASPAYITRMFLGWATLRAPQAGYLRLLWRPSHPPPTARDLRCHHKSKNPRMRGHPLTETLGAEKALGGRRWRPRGGQGRFQWHINRNHYNLQWYFYWLWRYYAKHYLFIFNLNLFLFFFEVLFVLIHPTTTNFRPRSDNPPVPILTRFSMISLNPSH